MADKALLYVLAFPDFAPEEALYLHSLRQKYCPPEQHKLTAHITLMYATPGNYTKAVCQAASECAKRHHNFDLTLTGLVTEHTPPDPLHYLFATPNFEEQKLQALHDDLYQTLPEARSFLLKPFKPHVTIGIFDAEKLCEQVLNEVRLAQWNIRGRVHRLTIIRWTGVLDEIVVKYELRA